MGEPWAPVCLSAMGREYLTVTVVPMKFRLVAGSLLACGAAVALTAFVFDLKLERAVVLAPLIVLALGAAAALVALWTRVALESLRRRRHPRLIVAVGLGVFALLVALSFFVGNLPHE